MKSKFRKTAQILNFLYGIFLLLFVLDFQGIFEIKSQFLKSVIYAYLFFGPFLIILNLFIFKSIRSRLIFNIAPVIFISLIIILHPLTILYNLGTWKTQTILYENKHHPNQKIEFQLKDMGAKGYNKRNAMITYFTPWFMVAQPIPNDIESNNEWEKVNEEVNEMDLKGG